MTQREIKARATLLAKVKNIREKMELPADPPMDRVLIRGSVNDIEGIYEGLCKMAAVQANVSPVY
jgi:hypothetical protein